MVSVPSRGEQGVLQKDNYEEIHEPVKFPSPLEADRFLYLIGHINLIDGEIVQFPSPTEVNKLFQTLHENGIVDF